MNPYRCGFAIILLSFSASAFAQEEPIRALLFTGGHGYEREPFMDVFSEVPNLKMDEVVHPEANEVFTNGVALEYDIIILYDMWQGITEEQKAGFIQFLESGKGLVGLHHCLASYQEWPEFIEILGGLYLESELEIHGETRPASTYKHDIVMEVTIADPYHPITRDMDNFSIFDEGYGGVFIHPETNVLLTTDHPEASGALAWAHEYSNSRVVYQQLGHGVECFEDANFRTLVTRSILWAANRLD